MAISSPLPFVAWHARRTRRNKSLLPSTSKPRRERLPTNYLARVSFSLFARRREGGMGATVIAAAPLSLLSRVANLECDSTMMIMRRQWWICTCANSVPMAQECCCSSICFSSLVNFVPSCSFWPLLLRHSFHSSSPSIAAARTKQMRGIICQDHLLRPLRPRQEMMRQKMGTGRKFFRFSLRRPQFAKRKKRFFCFSRWFTSFKARAKGQQP